MKKHILAVLMLSMAPAMAADESTDMRQLVNMPEPMKEMFLKNMRGHMESLDLIIAALAEGDLNDAAEIAEAGMGLGGGESRQCDDEDDAGHDHSAHEHEHKPTAHKAKAFGQFMPKEMKMMGMQLHISADKFAAVAREGNVGDAYRSLRNISASCVACHQSFQVK